MASAFLCNGQEILPTQGHKDIFLYHLLEALFFSLSHLDIHFIWN